MTTIVPADLVSNRIRERKSRIESEIAATKNQIEALSSKLAILNAQSALLSELIAGVHVQANIFDGMNTEQPAEAPVKPSDGVLQMLRSSPNGMRASEIADALERRIDTSSDNPRAIIRNTIHNLMKQGKIVRDERGTLTLG